MSTVGFIGSGKIGGTLARLAAGAGHDVVVSNSRGPETLSALVAELGPRGRAATAVEAAEAGEIVVVSIPLLATRDVPVEPLRGKVVIDTNNHYEERDGTLADLGAGDTPAIELLAAHLPESHVVRAFNNIFFEHLASMGRPPGAPGRTAIAIAGDDAAAKSAVAAFVDSIGYDVLDAGPLAESRRYAKDTPGYSAYLDPVGAFAAPGVPKSAPELEALLAQTP